MLPLPYYQIYVEQEQSLKKTGRTLINVRLSLEIYVVKIFYHI
jgi:hypothetical protein